MLPPTPVAPDVEHTIRLHKDDYEDFELRRHAAAKETILISGSEIRLKPFGTLSFVVQPPETQMTYHLQGEAPTNITDKTLRLREGTYVVNGTAAGYESFERRIPLISGQNTTVQVSLSRKEQNQPRIEVPIPKHTELPELFTETKNWKLDSDGFWMHETTTWLKDIHFNRVFEVLKIKKSLGRQEKIQWRLYLQPESEDRIECELDGTNYIRRQVIGGKVKEEIKKPHRSSEKTFFRLEIKVTEDGVVQKIGQVTDTIPFNIKGRTGFENRFGIRLRE